MEVRLYYFSLIKYTIASEPPVAAHLPSVDKARLINFSFDSEKVATNS